MIVPRTPDVSTKHALSVVLKTATVGRLTTVTMGHAKGLVPARAPPTRNVPVGTPVSPESAKLRAITPRTVNRPFIVTAANGSVIPYLRDNATTM